MIVSKGVSPPRPSYSLIVPSDASELKDSELCPMNSKEDHLHRKKTLCLSSAVNPATCMGCEIEFDDVNHVYVEYQWNDNDRKSYAHTEVDNIEYFRAPIFRNAREKLSICTG